MRVNKTSVKSILISIINMSNITIKKNFFFLKIPIYVSIKLNFNVKQFFFFF